MGQFIKRQGKRGFYFVLKAGNGEIIGVSEIYSSAAACAGGIESVRANAPAAALEDQTLSESAAHPKFEVYEDKAGEYRFRLKARNGEAILASEGYKTKDGCKKGIESVRKNSPNASVSEQ